MCGQARCRPSSGAEIERCAYSPFGGCAGDDVVMAPSLMARSPPPDLAMTVAWLSTISRARCMPMAAIGSAVPESGSVSADGARAELCFESVGSGVPVAIHATVFVTFTTNLGTFGFRHGQTRAPWAR